MSPVTPAVYWAKMIRLPLVGAVGLGRHALAACEGVVGYTCELIVFACAYRYGI